MIPSIIIRVKISVFSPPIFTVPNFIKLPEIFSLLLLLLILLSLTNSLSDLRKELSILLFCGIVFKDFRKTVLANKNSSIIFLQISDIFSNDEEQSWELTKDAHNLRTLLDEIFSLSLSLFVSIFFHSVSLLSFIISLCSFHCIWFR